MHLDEELRAQRDFRIPPHAAPRFCTGASRVSVVTGITIVTVKESLTQLPWLPQSEHRPAKDSRWVSRGSYRMRLMHVMLIILDRAKSCDREGSDRTPATLQG